MGNHMNESMLAAAGVGSQYSDGGTGLGRNRLSLTGQPSLAWPDRFFPFLFVVAENRVWSGSQTHLVFAPPSVVGGDNRRNVIKIWI